MNLPLSFREEHFSPSETAAITGLSLASQRDWRTSGFLRPRASGRATFSPRELAEIRMMIMLRNIGLLVADSQAMAEAVAPYIVFIILANHPSCVAVDGDRSRGEAYLDYLEKKTDEAYIKVMADVADKEIPLYGFLRGRRWQTLMNLDDVSFLKRVDVGTFFNFEEIAAFIAKAAPRPLFTLKVPATFG